MTRMLELKEGSGLFMFENYGIYENHMKNNNSIH